LTTPTRRRYLLLGIGMSLRTVGVVLAVAASCGLVACAGSPATDGRLQVVASFYPLAEAAQRVGGDTVAVTNLTAPGVEPHDLELTPSQLGAIADADVVLYVGGGFQPAVEDALADAGGRTVDVSEGLRSLPVPAGETEPSLTSDPHVWLDPVLYRRIVDEVDRTLSGALPADRPTFDVNAAGFDRELAGLDADYRSGLERCARDELVTSHAAFGYLAARYGLRQEAIAGLSPDAEPNPQRLADLKASIERDGVTTVFTEELLSPEVADTLAAATGVTTAILNPLESLTPAELSSGADYASVMRENLGELRNALGCS
jgi:zinc transport system substrate-binding protein